MVSPFGASNFLYGQKVTKEPSKGRGISISLSPLKSPLLKTTNTGGDCGPPYWMYPPGIAITRKLLRQNGPVADEAIRECGLGAGMC